MHPGASAKKILLVRVIEAGENTWRRGLRGEEVDEPATGETAAAI